MSYNSEKKKTNQKLNKAAVSMNDAVFQAFMIGVEFGYIQAEKGKNIQAARFNARAEWLQDGNYSDGQKQKTPGESS